MKNEIVTKMGRIAIRSWLQLQSLVIWALLVFAVGITGQCSPKERPNLGVDQLSGFTLDGQEIKLSNIDASGVVLNFYSPICKPCIEELPALNSFYQQVKEKGAVMYLAVESDLEKNGIDDLTSKDQTLIRQKLKERMLQDVARYKIEVPVLIMNPSFKIEPDQLVGGTPETLLFRTSPFRLYYNLIGPISTAQTADDLKRSSRYVFATAKLEEMKQAVQVERQSGY